MKQGLLVYQPRASVWRVWIDHDAYHIEPGEGIQININDDYFHALIEKEYDWIIRIEGVLTFMLNPNEIYTLLVNPDTLFVYQVPS